MNLFWLKKNLFLEYVLVCNYLQKLVMNLKKQKVVLSYIEEKNKDWSVVIDLAYSASMDEGVKDYLTHLQNIAIKLHEIDARHVNDLLSYMNAS